MSTCRGLAGAPRLASAIRAPGLANALARRQPRCFHSYDHPAADGPFGAVENAILAAAYRHVPEHGFSQRALGLGARDAGYLDISPSVLPEGSFSLIRYHLVTQRQSLESRSSKLFAHSTGRDMGIAEKVSELTWTRLMANEAVIQHWQQALAVMAHRGFMPTSLKELALLSDEIWYLAGDKAVDPSWYSKRASLSMIYSTAELFMTNDKSSGFAETRGFLNRRLAETQTVGNILGSLGQWAGFTASAGINVLRSKGVRV
ncbi:hypothetical protein HIM_08180 [Hirsutella minnesotensis 3608]|uniref:Ubiquinone biosynthesis protein n=1 Tax=Hirsutella minnesotensis 3608 TaxID=1043627 RepID=A0A0F7ZYF4_9HYPO|nr:hypothetical protein HIM_08180 [Hirsutella minnesotensis 3608]